MGGRCLNPLEWRCLPQLLSAPLTSAQRLQSTPSSCICNPEALCGKWGGTQASTTTLKAGSGAMEMLTVFQSQGTGRRTKKSIAEAMAPAPFHVSRLSYLHADP